MICLLTVTDCDAKTAQEVTRRLRAEGYLSATPGSHSKGFSQKKLPQFVVVRSELQKERMKQTYFSPLADIAHHVGLGPFAFEAARRS